MSDLLRWFVSSSRSPLVRCVRVRGPGRPRQGKGAFGGIGMSGSGVLPGADGQDNAVIEAAAPGVEFAAGMPLGAAVVDAGPAQPGEGDRITARLGQEV